MNSFVVAVHGAVFFLFCLAADAVQVAVLLASLLDACRLGAFSMRLRRARRRTCLCLRPRVRPHYDVVERVRDDRAGGRIPA